MLGKVCDFWERTGGLRWYQKKLKEKNVSCYIMYESLGVCMLYMYAYINAHTFSMCGQVGR